MALTQSQRNSIASYRVQIEGYRKNLDRLREDKRSKSAYYANLIKGTKDQNSKRSYRQSKISAINSIVNQIESVKRDIDRVKGYIKSVRG